MVSPSRQHSGRGAATECQATECQATECQGDRRPSGLNAKATECQATECQGDFRPSRLNAKATWTPSILCFYTMIWQFARLIISLYYKSISRDTKGRGKNSRFFQTLAKMGFFLIFGLDLGGGKGDCRFFESHRRFSCLPFPLAS